MLEIPVGSLADALGGKAEIPVTRRAKAPRSKAEPPSPGSLHFLQILLEKRTSQCKKARGFNAASPGSMICEMRDGYLTFPALPGRFGLPSAGACWVS